MSYKLRVQCIKCHKVWEKESEIPWGPEDFSSSLCNDCFVIAASPVIHKKQKNEGNFDCFGSAQDYCDQSECKYRKWCLHLEEEIETQNLVSQPIYASP